MKVNDRNRLEYQKRVNRVLDYIRAHRGEELSLDALADVAAFSPFHFHRIFKAMTGENVYEFIQRTRLEAAASHLISRPHVDILELALENGFGSASAFARVFKERFGMSASTWRAGGAPHLRAPGSNDGQTDRNDGEAQGNGGKAERGANVHHAFSTGLEGPQNEEEIMNVKVETLPTYRVAYMRTTGPYGPDGGIQVVWGKLNRWAAARDLWTDNRVCLGISHDDPKVTEPAKCRYDAAIVIPERFAVDGEVNVVDVEGGKYAVAAFVGPASEIAAAYDQLFGGWLPQSGFQPDNRLIFERYRGNFSYDPKTGIFNCEICVPVRAL